MRKPTVIIGKFGPSARQILDAAVVVASRPETTLVVGSRPEGGTVLGGAEWAGPRKKDYERGLSYLHDLSARLNLKNQVFLGGACGVTTWRKEIAIPLLETNGCAYYNPQVDDWGEQDARLKAQGVVGGIMAVEAEHKVSSYVMLFVFDGAARSIATLNECVEFMMAGKQKVVIVSAYVDPGQVIEGQALTVTEAMDINIARAELFGIAKAHGVQVYSSIKDAVQQCVDLILEASQDYTVLDVAV